MMAIAIRPVKDQCITGRRNSNSSKKTDLCAHIKTHRGTSNFVVGCNNLKDASRVQSLPPLYLSIFTHHPGKH
jgi:hypothetical protein